MELELEAKQWMKERQLSSITAAEYQSRACETSIFRRTRQWSTCALVWWERQVR